MEKPTITLGNGEWAYKEGRLLASAKTLNQKYGALPLTVVRANADDSASEIGKDGILRFVEPNIPRFSWSDGVASLLTEPQVTCLTTNSNTLYFSGGTINTNSAISPDGLQEASQIVKTSSSVQYQNVFWSGGTLSSSTDYVMDVWVKKDSYDFTFRMEHNVSGDFGGGWYAEYTLTSEGITLGGTSNSTSGYEAHANGWFRVWVKVTTGTVTTSGSSYLIRLIGDTGTSMLQWQNNMCANAFITSTIKTTGASKTRVKDQVYGLGGTPYAFNSSEGSLKIEASILKNPITLNNWYTISDGTTSNFVAIVFETNGQIAFRVDVGGVGQYYYSQVIDYENNHTYELRWADNSFESLIDEVSVDTQLSGSTFPVDTLNDFSLRYPSGSNEVAGKTKKIIIS